MGYKVELVVFLTGFFLIVIGYVGMAATLSEYADLLTSSMADTGAIIEKAGDRP